MARRLLPHLFFRKLALFVLCLFLSEMLYRFAPVSLIGVVSKTVSIFIGTIWVTVMAFSLKIAEVTDIPGLTVDEHMSLEEKARKGIKYIWVRAVSNVLGAILVMLPAIFVDGKIGAVWHWMVLGAGLAVAWSIVTVIDQACWQEDFRRLKSRIKLRERKVLAYEASVKAMHGYSSEDWAQVDEEISRYNRKGEWRPGTEDGSTGNR